MIFQTYRENVSWEIYRSPSCNKGVWTFRFICKTPWPPRKLPNVLVSWVSSVLFNSLTRATKITERTPWQIFHTRCAVVGTGKPRGVWARNQAGEEAGEGTKRTHAMGHVWFPKLYGFKQLDKVAYLSAITYVVSPTFMSFKTVFWLWILSPLTTIAPMY